MLQPAEAVAATWERPADVIARHGRGELTLYPPTWVTLHGLSKHPDLASILGAARLAGIERFETSARRGADGPILLWHGDEEYETDASGPAAGAAPGPGPAAAPGLERASPPAEAGIRASGARHRLEIGALPWRYTRDG